MYEVAHARSQRLRIPVVTWLYWIGVHIPALLLSVYSMLFFVQDQPDGGEIVYFGLFLLMEFVCIGSISIGQAWILKRTINPQLFSSWISKTMFTAMGFGILSFMLQLNSIIDRMYQTPRTIATVQQLLPSRLILMTLLGGLIGFVQARILHSYGYRMWHWIAVQGLSYLCTTSIIGWLMTDVRYIYLAGTIPIVMAGAGIINSLGLFLIQPIHNHGQKL
ncbi:hypothetical protein [Herpetosiphon sp. NSE202]|uniref:hypothetical protein n=1 Tax=Herpetosiphon sp. NSE202 TaxID=3351349 RepID=UPI003639F345